MVLPLQAMDVDVQGARKKGVICNLVRGVVTWFAEERVRGAFALSEPNRFEKTGEPPLAGSEPVQEEL